MMWDDESGAYRERDLHGEEGVTGTIADLFPLYAGAPNESQARRLVDEHLLAPDRFGPSTSAPWAVTTVSKSSPDYNPRNYSNTVRGGVGSGNVLLRSGASPSGHPTEPPSSPRGSVRVGRA